MMTSVVSRCQAPWTWSERIVRVQVKELGAGSFGTCKLAIDHDGEYVAVKFIPRGRKVRLDLPARNTGMLDV